MSNWVPFQFIKSPFEQAEMDENADKPLPNIEHLPITTRKGRVIYNRKPHKFTEKDFERIAKNFLKIETENSAKGFELLLQRITIWMLDKILERFTFGQIPDDFAEDLYYDIWRLLNGLIQKLTPEQVSAIVPEDKQEIFIA